MAGARKGAVRFLLSGIVIAWVPAAAATAKYQTVRTQGWSAQIPADWKLVAEKKTDPAAPYVGLWVYKSPKGNFRMRVRLSHDKGRTFKDIARKSFTRLVRRVPKLTLLRSKVLTLQGSKIWYILGDARMVRKNRNHNFLLFRLLMQAPFGKKKIVLMVQMRGSDEKLGTFEPIVDKFMDSFALVDAKSLASARAPAQRGKPSPAAAKGGRR